MCGSWLLAGQRILISEELPFFEFEPRGEIVIPGHGTKHTYVLIAEGDVGIHPSALLSLATLTRGGGVQS